MRRFNVHGGLQIRDDGTYSAERGVDVVGDTQRCAERLKERLVICEAFLVAQVVGLHEEREEKTQG